jgi:hypothetical protein
MINQIKLILDQIEYTALLQIAMDELRTPPDEIRHILRQELARRGLLTRPVSEIAAPAAQEPTHAR